MLTSLEPLLRNVKKKVYILVLLKTFVALRKSLIYEDCLTTTSYVAMTTCIEKQARSGDLSKLWGKGLWGVPRYGGGIGEGWVNFSIFGSFSEEENDLRLCSYEVGEIW
jgi:hypothetical protein